MKSSVVLLLLSACASDPETCTIDSSSTPPVMRCPDGTSAELGPGQNGTSCTVQNNNDGTSTISCTDGTVATLSNGDDGTSCSATPNGNGTVTVSCSDGTSAVLQGGTSATPGTLVGTAQFYGRLDHTGIRVEVVGTSLATTTRVDGTWRLDLVPWGVHTLRFSTSGYATRDVGNIPVLEGTFVITPQMMFVGERFLAATEVVVNVANDDGSSIVATTSDGTLLWNGATETWEPMGQWNYVASAGAPGAFFVEYSGPPRARALLDVTYDERTDILEWHGPIDEAGRYLVFLEHESEAGFAHIALWSPSTRTVQVALRDFPMENRFEVSPGYLYAVLDAATEVRLAEINLSTLAYRSSGVFDTFSAIQPLAGGRAMLRADADNAIYVWGSGASAQPVRFGVPRVYGFSGSDVALAFITDETNPGELVHVDVLTLGSRTLDTDVFAFGFSPGGRHLVYLRDYAPSLETGELAVYDAADDDVDELGPKTFRAWRFLDDDLLVYLSDWDGDLAQGTLHVRSLSSGTDVLMREQSRLLDVSSPHGYLVASGSESSATLELLELPARTVRTIDTGVEAFTVQTRGNYVAYTRNDTDMLRLVDLRQAMALPINLGVNATGLVLSEGENRAAVLIGSQLWVRELATVTAALVDENAVDGIQFVGEELLVYRGAAESGFTGWRTWRLGDTEPTVLTTLSETFDVRTVDGAVAAMDVPDLVGGKLVVYDADSDTLLELPPGVHINSVVMAPTYVLYAAGDRLGMIDLRASEPELVPVASDTHFLHAAEDWFAYSVSAYTFPTEQDNGLYRVDMPQP